MKRAFLLLAVIAVSLSAWCQAPANPGNAAPTASHKEKVSPFAEYAGLWTARFEGKIWLQLRLELAGEVLTGSLIHPHNLELNDNGELKSVSEEQVTEIVSDAVVNPDGLLLYLKDSDTQETDRYVMRVVAPDNDTAELKMVAMSLPPGMPKPKPWRLVRSGIATTNNASAPR